MPLRTALEERVARPDLERHPVAFELMRNLCLQLSVLDLITLLPLRWLPCELECVEQPGLGDMPRPLTLVTMHMLTTSLTIIVSWSLCPLLIVCVVMSPE